MRKMVEKIKNSDIKSIQGKVVYLKEGVSLKEYKDYDEIENNFILIDDVDEEDLIDYNEEY